MDETYSYTTINEQIKKLKSQQLVFEDEAEAKIILKTYGYYNIINGYRDPYITREYDKKIYNPGVTFEQIFSLFKLDHSLRNAVMLSMVDLEEHLRSVTADIIGEDFGVHHNNYLADNNYRDKRVSDAKFSRKNILASMRKVANTSYTQPIRYYREKYNDVPPWILFKGIYFGTLVNFIRILKGPQRNKLVKTLYGSKVNNSNIDQFKNLLSDTLFMCLEYRNLAAHGGRVYNYRPKSSLRPFDNKVVNKGLPQLLYALNFFYCKSPYNCLGRAADKSLNDYCHLYPDDISRLEAALGFKITAENHVWINFNSKRYHVNPHCSGANNCKQVTLKQAESLGYIACKKCCNNITLVE